MSDTLLRVAHPSAGYGDMAVLRDIALEVLAGEIVAIGADGSRAACPAGSSRCAPSRGRSWPRRSS